MAALRDIWRRMAAGDDPGVWIGLPEKGKGTGPGFPGTGEGGPPDSLTEEQKRKLMKFFHEHYGRYPLSDYEFRQWLRDNW